MNKLHIHVVSEPDGPNYRAWADEEYTPGLTEAEKMDQGDVGCSPDEALGGLIRDMWLAGHFDTPVKIEFDFRTE